MAFNRKASQPTSCLFSSKCFLPLCLSFWHIMIWPGQFQSWTAVKHSLHELSWQAWLSLHLYLFHSGSSKYFLVVFSNQQESSLNKFCPDYALNPFLATATHSIIGYFNYNCSILNSFFPPLPVSSFLQVLASY